MAGAYMGRECRNEYVKRGGRSLGEGGRGWRSDSKALILRELRGI